jgi:hypothetical protein
VAVKTRYAEVVCARLYGPPSACTRVPRECIAAAEVESAVGDGCDGVLARGVEVLVARLLLLLASQLVEHHIDHGTADSSSSSHITTTDPCLGSTVHATVAWFLLCSSWCT